MDFFNDDVNYLETFSNHNLVVFESKGSKEQVEIINILKKQNFKKIFVVSNVNDVLNIVETTNVSIIFFSIENINDIQMVRNIIENRETKIFLTVDNITNELFKLKPDEFIFNPSSSKEISIYRLIHKHLLLIENTLKHKFNELKITEQQKNFDKIFELLSNNSLITKTDIHGKIIYANEIFQKISGYRKNDILGKNHSIIRHEKTSDKEIKEIWEEISNKRIWSGILRNKTRLGHDYIVDTKIIPELDVEGEITNFLSVQYDITDLVHKNELAKLLMDEQSNPILIGQVGKGITNASNEFLTQFGFADLNIFSSNKTTLLDLAYELENQDTDNLELFRNNETVTLKNLKLITNYDTVKIFDVIQKKITTPFGNYFLITLNDITVSQKEVADAKNEAAVKSNFLATMSHEIRTPLNGMIPYIDLLLESGNYNLEQLDYISTIKQSSEGLLRIINDILDFSKIECGKLEIEYISFDPVREFETVIDLYVAKADEKEINLYTYIEPTLPNLIGDPLRIKQIINNLLSNAIKFTPEHGEIIFSVEDISKNKDYVELSIFVKDNGKGIEKEQQENIFTPFSQADNSISRKFGGTGLGLSISNDLAKMMGGTITLQSQPGNGCKFILNLQLDKDNNISNTKYNDDNDHFIGIYTFDDTKYKCEILLLCKYLKSMKFAYKKIKDIKESEQCDVVFVISSGEDNIPYFTEEFTKITKVITILGSTVENRNKFHSNAIIQMPINGSKIYDAIVDIERLHQQNEYLLKYSSKSVAKYKANVLVAEDMPTNQKLVKTLLSKHGIVVDIAENGKIAYEKYMYDISNNNSNYDLIFLDIHMPIMDGIEAIKKIREFEYDNNMNPINIVALTADAIKTHQQQYLDVGFNDFLAKPIERLKFEETLKKYLIDNLILAQSTEEINTSDNILEIKQSNTNNAHSKKSNIERVCENLELDEEIVIVLMNDFMDNWKVYEKEINIAIDELEHNKIREIAHSLKGAAGSLMLDEVYEQCKSLEEIARNKTISDSKLYKDLLLNLKKDIEN